MRAEADAPEGRRRGCRGRRLRPRRPWRLSPLPLGPLPACPHSRGWLGIARPGAFAEYVAEPDARRLLPLDGLDPVRAAPLTDVGLTAHHAVRRAAPACTPTGTLVVIGLGDVGQAATPDSPGKRARSES
ncbi:hypothetical protein [Streptomyces sp. NPDC096311]|uniref:hypothetical protein n=1 Tax=Streptomyces sp. NPDC096311 TaxID=3366083 RepID=UPI0037FE3771